jgi:hypothetical protein
MISMDQRRVGLVVREPPPPPDEPPLLRLPPPPSVLREGLVERISPEPPFRELVLRSTDRDPRVVVFPIVREVL